MGVIYSPQIFKDELKGLQPYSGVILGEDKNNGV